MKRARWCKYDGDIMVALNHWLGLSAQSWDHRFLHLLLNLGHTCNIAQGSFLCLITIYLHTSIIVSFGKTFPYKRFAISCVRRSGNNCVEMWDKWFTAETPERLGNVQLQCYNGKWSSVERRWGFESHTWSENLIFIPRAVIIFTTSDRQGSETSPWFSEHTCGFSIPI